MKQLMLTALMGVLVAIAVPAVAQNRKPSYKPIQLPTAQRTVPVLQQDLELPPLDYTNLIQNPTFHKLPRDIQDDIVEEAEQIYSNCLGRPLYNRYHDCDCIGSKFIDARVNDPEAHHSLLLQSISGICPNIPALAGHSYNQCIVIADLPKRVDASEYCECFGNTMANKYAERPVATFSATTFYSSAAYAECDAKFRIGVADFNQ